MIIKSVIFSAFFCLIALPVLGDQTSCEISQKTLLDETSLEKLTLAVCPRQEPSKADIHLEYEEQYKIKTAKDFLVYQYTDKCYEKINRELFKLTPQDFDILKLAEQLDAVLCEYPKSKDTVFRGANLPDDVILKYSNAKEISFPAFSSASKIFNVACDFAKKGNTLYKIISKSGRYLGDHSKHTLEEEVLFRTNTSFKVINAYTGAQASTLSGCSDVSHYFELEEI